MIRLLKRCAAAIFWFASTLENSWVRGGVALTRTVPLVSQVECDGKRLELPPDIEGVLFLNIGSFMGEQQTQQYTHARLALN